MKIDGFELTDRLFAVPPTEKRRVLGIARVDLCQERLNVGISVEATRFLLENVVGAHTASGKIPHPLLIFGAIGMSVEVARPIIALILQQLDQEEHALDALAAK